MSEIQWTRQKPHVGDKRQRRVRFVGEAEYRGEVWTAREMDWEEVNWNAYEFEVLPPLEIVMLPEQFVSSMKSIPPSGLDIPMPACAPLKDSGKREEFNTGSRRDSREGKGRFDLLFMGMSEAMRRLAVLLERGAAKYGERNWERGQPVARYIDSAVRHIARAATGAVDEDHLIQAAWNCLAAAETLHKIKEGKLPGDLNGVYATPDVEPK